MNWSKMIRDLQQAGVTQVAIARYVGRSQAWVSEVATGRYTAIEWKDGESLRRLHAQTFQAPAASESQTFPEAA